LKEFFKKCAITPDKVYAGDSVEFEIKLTVGKDFKTKGSRIVLDMPATLGFSRPSTYSQEDAGFIFVLCSNPDVWYEEKIWNVETEDFVKKQRQLSSPARGQRFAVIDFTGGELSENDEITVKWGYVKHGHGIGAKVTTIVPLMNYDSVVDVRYFCDGTRAVPDLGRSFKGYVRPVPDEEISLAIRISPREPVNMRVITKTDGTKTLLIYDRFYNLCDIEDVNNFVKSTKPGAKNPHGAFEFPCGAEISSLELPLTETAAMNGVFNGLNIYWGDFHTHSASSNDCLEREKMFLTPSMCLDYAREAACLDFMAVTDHHQPWDKEQNRIGAELWEDLRKAVDGLNKRKDFAAFTGFEYRCPRGDTAVVFKDNVPYSVADNPEMVDIRVLWEKFKELDYITIPHFYSSGKLEPDEWYACPYDGVEPVLEIYSCHGSYESEKVLEQHIPDVKQFRPDRTGRYFLDKGYIFGLCCNSDGHKGNPGNNGLTAVYAPDLSCGSIFKAVKNRNVYGTTNARIKLLFAINGNLMGAVLPGSEAMKNILVDVTGENIIKTVDIIRDGEIYKRFKPASLDFKIELDAYDETQAYWYVRVTQIDNHIAYSSPVFFK